MANSIFDFCGIWSLFANPVTYVRTIQVSYRGRGGALELSPTPIESLTKFVIIMYMDGKKKPMVYK